MKSVILRKITGDAYDEFACCFALDTAEDMILNYCHLSAVPSGLSRTVLSLAADLLRAGLTDGGSTPTGIHAVTVGDARAEFNEANDLQALLQKYETSLNRYRKVEFS